MRPAVVAALSGGGSLEAVIASLFANGEQGLWLDPSDLSTMFQDDGGTTPAAVDAVVGLIRDKSGRGNHAPQTSSGNRPILRFSGGLYYLEFDGSDDFLVTSSIDFSGGDKISVFASVYKASDAAVGSVVGLSSAPQTNTGTFELFAPANAGTANFAFRSRGSSSATPSPTGHAAPLTRVLTGLGDISGDSATIYVDGIATVSSADQGTGNYGNSPIYIGARGGTSNRFNGRLYGLIVRAGVTIQPQLAQVQRYLGIKSGIAA
jgi:hypothetical protein